MHVFMFLVLFFFFTTSGEEEKNCFLFFLFFNGGTHTHHSLRKMYPIIAGLMTLRHKHKLSQMFSFFLDCFLFHPHTHTHTVCWAEQCSKLLASSPNHLPWDHVHLTCSCVCVCVCVRVFTQVDMQHGYTHRRALIALFFRNVGVCAHQLHLSWCEIQKDKNK